MCSRYATPYRGNSLERLFLEIVVPKDHLRYVKKVFQGEYLFRFSRNQAKNSKPRLNPDLRQNRIKLVVRMISYVFFMKIFGLSGFFNPDLHQYRIKSALFSSLIRIFQ